MANELNIGVKFGAEGIPQVARAVSQVDSELSGLRTTVAATAQTFQSQLTPSIQKATQIVQRFKSGLRVDPTGQTSLLNTANNLEDVDKSARLAASGVNAFKNAASAGNGIVTDFSRVIQDLPFGFLGIANNLTQIPGGLQRLSAAAKESGKSIGSLILSSVTGFGGIGLALSLVTSGLLIAQNGIAGFGRASKKAKEDAEELEKVIRSIGDIQAEATGGVQGQVAQVNALANAVADSNRPYAERKRALEELQGINKAYFGDLKLEDAATGKLTKTIEEYNKALVSQAIVKAFVNEIAEVAKAAAKADTELAKATQRVTNAEKELATAKTNRSKSGGGREGIAQTYDEAFANKALIEAIKERSSQSEKVTDLLTQQVVLQNELNKAQGEALKFKSLEPEKSKQEVDLLKKRLAELEKIKDATKDIFTITDLEEQIFDLKVKITLRDAAKNGLSKEETDLAIAGFKNQLTEAFNREALALEAIPKVKVTDIELVPLDSGVIESKIAKAVGLDKTIPIKSDRQVKIELLGLEFVLAQEEAQKAVEKLRETVVNGAVDALASASTAFGEAISGIFSGGIGNALAKGAQTLLNGIGGVLQEIGKQIIATSTLIKALKEALKSLIANPVAGIAIGVGLIALGGLLKNIKIPGFASGVNNFSGGLAIVGERGPELVNLPRGSDVIPNHMLGGETNVTLSPVVSFGYDRLYVGLQRQSSRRERLG